MGSLQRKWDRIKKIASLDVEVEELEDIIITKDGKIIKIGMEDINKLNKKIAGDLKLAKIVIAVALLALIIASIDVIVNVWLHLS